MASWFIIGLATLSLVSIMMFTGANLVASTTSMSNQAETISRINKLADLVLSNAYQDQNGDVHLPMVTYAASGAAAGVSTLPANLSPQAISTNGYPFIYCPFGDLSNAPNATITLPNSPGYEVGTASYNGTTYVVSGRPAYADAASNSDLLGFLMAQKTNQGGFNGCDQITGSAGNYAAPNMYVKPLLRSRATNINLSQQTTAKTIYVSSTGTGNGINQTTPTSLTQALATWRQTPYVTTKIIILDNASYVVPSTTLTSVASDYVIHPSNAQLTIGGQGSTNLNTNDGLNLPVNVTLLGLNFYGPININSGTSAYFNGVNHYNGSLNILENANFKALTFSYSYTGGPAISIAKGATASISELSTTPYQFTSGSNYPIFTVDSGGTLNLTGDVSDSTTGFDYSNFVFNGATGTTNPISIAQNATVNIAVSNIYENASPNYIISNSGTLNTSHSQIIANNNGTLDLLINSGSNSNLYETLLQTTGPTINIVSNGAANVSGTLGDATLQSATISGGAVLGWGNNATHMINGNVLGGLLGFIFGAQPYNTVNCWADNTATPVFAYSGTGRGSSSAVTSPGNPAALIGTPTTGQIAAYQNAVSAYANSLGALNRNHSAWSCN